MISYYGHQISPNQLETGEGFLICRNVPIARTGKQKYMGEEIGQTPGVVFDVDRPESEVFAEETIASFEGKPFTNNHPTEAITVDNVKLYETGHVQNVRRGVGEFKDFLVADIHIHDAETIDAIKGGKRQISCGYDCEYIADENGALSQTKIRGNHVALVDEGRAGVKASIMDSINTTAEQAERKEMNKKSKLLKLFGLAANGKSEEELDRLALDTADALDENASETPAEPDAAEGTKVADNAADEQPGATLDDLNAKLDKLIELLTPKADLDEKPAEEQPKDEIAEAIEAIEAEKTEADPNEAKVVPAEEMNDECPTSDTALDGAMQAYILSNVREAVAGITDEAQRKTVSDAILGAVKAKTNDLDSILAAMSGARAKTTSYEDLQAKYDAMNPHHNNKEA